MEKHDNKKSRKLKLSSEEEDLLSSFERGEWESVDNVESEIALAREVASSYLKKMHIQERNNCSIFLKK